MVIERVDISLFNCGIESYIGEIEFEQDENGNAVLDTGHPVLNIGGLDLQTNSRTTRRIRKSRVLNYFDLFVNLGQRIECAFINPDKVVGSQKTAVIRIIDKS